ncbi:hypothetical protein HPB49_021529 [Dermacentor silvarum]|uniref:Uncharacterized protein n=1 Tax=Dermacentor silvarum TaxID=543639 RepID=A0ACB8DG49_DERSI|nr:hypothetical protein HPB49_021529 [Dermacentor silvarum]
MVTLPPDPVDTKEELEAALDKKEILPCLVSNTAVTSPSMKWSKKRPVNLDNRKMLALRKWRVALLWVNHSQRLRGAPLKAWILADVDGSIVTVHCTYMAGAGETCSHVGATLFAVETAVGMRDARTCTEKENTWLPANNPTAAFKRTA